jgi:hypothetical protein
VERQAAAGAPPAHPMSTHSYMARGHRCRVEHHTAAVRGIPLPCAVQWRDQLLLGSGFGAAAGYAPGTE